MPLTPQQILEQETNAFLDSQFGSLDLSGCPSLLTPPSEESQLPDPRFAPLDDRGLGLGSSALKRGIEELVNEREVQDQIARETGDPELIWSLQQQRAGSIARDFIRQNPTYYRSPRNWELVIQTLAYNCLRWEPDEAEADEAEEELIRRGHFTLQNLNDVFKALSRAGSLEAKPGLLRTLSEHELRAVALQAASGDVEGAVTRYLVLRLPEDFAETWQYSTSLQEALDGIADPEYKSVVREAVWFCWENGRANYSPTPERRRFLQEYVAGRIPTARLLDEAWAVCQASERDGLRSSLLQQIESGAQSGAPDLDVLTDDEIERLYHGTMRKIATDSHQKARS